MSARKELQNVLKIVLKELDIEDIEPHLEHPADSSHGDYSSNIALVAAKMLKRKPIDIAEEIKRKLEIGNWKLEIIGRVEVAPPGFINFWLSQEYLISSMVRIRQLQEEYGRGGTFQDKKNLVEFAHPNTHKEFHIGHLRNVILGEAICRLLVAQGAKVRRVNYQGDVGLHVAKALYGLLQEFKIQNSKFAELAKKSLEERIKILGQAYAGGSKAYEENEQAREEITEINRKIYGKDPGIMDLWEKTRQWSLDYFDAIYERLGTKFDRLYFESEVFESGKDIVLAHIKDGIFTQDQGAIIFNGEKYGLHKRVFVTKEGYATYEGKEMGLGPLQYKEFPFDVAIHVVGPEQAGYFSVTFKALELIDQRLTSKEKHLSYGLVQLKEGKMSSRLGNVVAGLWLLDETKRILAKAYTSMPEEVLEQVAVGAVKYSMLRVGLSQSIRFSFDESISLEGNSGPYLQYTYARTQSILSKSKIQNPKFETNAKFKMQKPKLLITNYELQPEEVSLLRAIHRFPEVVEEAAVNFAPNLLCNYLFELAQNFNLFYQKHKILSPVIASPQGEAIPNGIATSRQGGTRDDIYDFRLAITTSVGQVLKNGLTILAIAAPQRM